VINWTLSDYKRRLIVPVGVRYGTDPEQVLELLLEAARENDQVLSDPEPVSLFLAHGESSLDFELRVFTESHRSWMAVLSDLTVSINRMLKEAIQSRVEASQPRWSPANLEEPIRAAISRFESPLLRGSTEKAHQALQGLLRGNRITVHQSPYYNIEGTAELTLETHTAGRPETTGRMLFSSKKW